MPFACRPWPRNSASMPSNGHHPQTTTFTIDGFSAADYRKPVDALECARMLAEASALGRAVTPVGGGTALNLGNLPERVELMISTEGLSGIIDYEPTDLVLSVGAGARFGDVQAILAEHGQRLPIDPPGGPAATIGGLIATARWGPLRYSAGTLRDLLIGISVAHPSGTLTKAGGMVVKNVSGYDMPRLYLGSLGTLGIITSANFKVLPRPRAEATILAAHDRAEAAFAFASRLHVAREPIAALEVVQRAGAWTVAVRVEGRDQTVEMVRRRISAEAPEDISHFDSEASAAWWADFVSHHSPQDPKTSVLVRCGVRPKDTATLALGIIAAMANVGVTVPYLAASPGIGTVLAELKLGADGSAEMLADVQTLLLGIADAVTIVVAPSLWKRGIDIWGRLPDGFEVMASLRQQFDPSRTINPGRFAGFL